MKGLSLPIFVGLQYYVKAFMHAIVNSLLKKWNTVLFAILTKPIYGRRSNMTYWQRLADLGDWLGKGEGCRLDYVLY